MTENRPPGKKRLLIQPWEPPSKHKLRRDIFEAVEQLKSNGSSKGKEFALVAQQFQMDRNKVRYNYMAELKERKQPDSARPFLDISNVIPTAKVFYD